MTVLRNVGFAATTTLLLLAGCGGEESPGSVTTPTGAITEEHTTESIAASVPERSGQVIVFATRQIELSIPGGWFANEAEHPYDLQYIAPRQTMNTGVFVYDSGEFQEGMTPQEVFQFHLEDLGSKRTNFTALSPQATKVIEDKTITSALFSGEKDGEENYYQFTLIEFADDTDLFLVLLQVSLPENWGANQPTLSAIAHSVKWLPPVQ